MKRVLSVFLILCLVLSLSLPVGAVSSSKIITTPTGYKTADDVEYVTHGGYIANWGARGEDCVFLSPNAQDFYIGSNTYENFAAMAGGTGTSDAPSSDLYSALKSFMSSKHTHVTSYGETRYQYCYTDCLLSDYNKISCFYSGATLSGTWDGGSTWNREHTWPNSKGDASGNGENDIMMLRPVSVSENSSRGNKAYGTGSGFFDPGVSVRGDVARIMLYVYVRWGNTGSMWGSSGVIQDLDLLLAWMEADPVDTWEMGRNDAVESITGTRNVFVDYPELAFLLFGEQIPEGMTTPSGNTTSACTHTNTELRNAEDADCTNAGYTGDTYCLDCGQKTADGTTIPHLGHINENGDNVCDRPGCGASMTCGHGSTSADESTAVAPDCTNDGQEANIYCDYCGELTQKGATIGKLGHLNANQDDVCDRCNGSIPCEHGKTHLITQKDATCTEEGYTGDTYCDYCETVIEKGTTISKLPHPNTDKDNKCDECHADIDCGHGKVYMGGYVAPTCTETGREKSIYCSYCDALRTEGDTIPATGHCNEDGDNLCDVCNANMDCKHGETVIRNAKDATCGTNGYSGDECCVHCGDVVTPGSIVYATSLHVNTDGDNQCDVCQVGVTCGHGKSEVLDAKEATCSKPGYTGDTYCAYCGAPLEYGDSIPATGHTDKNNDLSCDTCEASLTCTHEKSELLGAQAATCGKNGYSGDQVCVQCGQVTEAGKAIPATGAHNFGAWSTEGSVDTRTCKTCGHQEQKQSQNQPTEPSAPTEPSTPTNPSAPTDPAPTDPADDACPHAESILQGAQEVTCTRNGYTGDLYCADCGEKTASGEIIAAPGHSNTDADGHCDVCDADLSCTHEKTHLENASDATCGADGYTGDTVCSDCGDVVETGDVIPATGEHSFSEWTSNEDLSSRYCTVCGHQEVEYNDPSEPTDPEETAPTDPAPTEPAPTEPMEPSPTEPSEPSPTDPAPTAPGVQPEDPVPSTQPEDPEPTAPVWPWILIAILLVIIIVAIVLLKKKK